MKLAVLISVLVTAIWFRSGLMFGGGEEGLPFHNPSKYFSLVSNIWFDANGGYPVILHLPRAPFFWVVSQITQLGVSANFLQAATFAVLIFTGCLAAIFLTKELLDVNTPTSVTAGIFYLFNLYSMSQIWSRGIYAQFFAFALVPAFLYLFIKCLKTQNPIYLGMAIAVNFVLSSAYVVVTNVIVLWVPVILYFILYVYEGRASKKIQLTTLIYMGVLMLLWILTNFWWVLPSIGNASGAYYHFLTGSNNLDSLRGMSQMYFKPQWVIRLFQGFIFFLSNAYNNAYSSLSFRLLSWLVPAVALVSLGYVKKYHWLRYILLMWFFGFFFSIGVNFPTGSIFTWFFKNFSFLQAFRNPYEKAGLILMLPYSLLFAVGWSWFFKKSKIIAFTIIIGVCGVLVWPMWSGGVTNAWVKIPEYYREADSWISSQNGDFKIIQMPLIAGDGVKYDWDNTYQGIEPSEFLFKTSSIGRNVAFNKPYYNILLQKFGIFSSGSFGPDPDISKSEFISPYLWEELNKLAVRYIVFHRDYDKNTLNSNSTNTRSNLEKEQNIKYIKSFGKLDIYEVANPDSISRLYSPNTNIKILSKSTDFYKFMVSADNAVTVSLLDLYDPGWELFVDNRKIDTHKKMFGYANSWEINKRGNYEAIVKYTPQDNVKLGWNISFMSIVLVIVVMLAFKYYEYKKQ